MQIGLWSEDTQVKVWTQVAGNDSYQSAEPTERSNLS